MFVKQYSIQRREHEFTCYWKQKVYENKFIHVFIRFFVSFRRRILRKYISQLRKTTYGSQSITMNFINYIMKQIQWKWSKQDGWGGWENFSESRCGTHARILLHINVMVPISRQTCYHALDSVEEDLRTIGVTYKDEIHKIRKNKRKS
jgi:hypothetical protein